MGTPHTLSWMRWLKSASCGDLIRETSPAGLASGALWRKASIASRKEFMFHALLNKTRSATTLDICRALMWEGIGQRMRAHEVL